MQKTEKFFIYEEKSLVGSTPGRLTWSHFQALIPRYLESSIRFFSLFSFLLKRLLSSARARCSRINRNLSCFSSEGFYGIVPKNIIRYSSKNYQLVYSPKMIKSKCQQQPLPLVQFHQNTKNNKSFIRSFSVLYCTLLYIFYYTN